LFRGRKGKIGGAREAVYTATASANVLRREKKELSRADLKKAAGRKKRESAD